jgi:hypothetical protein
MKRPSPAMIVACLALVVALGGTAAASSGLINGAQIKNHTIGPTKLTATAISYLRGHSGAVGPRGAAGPEGPAGPAGGFDPAKVVYVAGPQTDLPANAAAGAQTLTATCPAGTKVIGGGGAPEIALEGGSFANPDGSGWSLVVVNDTTVDIPDAFAMAVCAAP